jgi:predicted amidohydrolase YtcJ
VVAAEAGLGAAIHAIGDAAVRMVLDAFEEVRAMGQRGRNMLLRTEHAQLVHPDDVKRFKDLGVIASMQPIHAVADWRTADTHWGRRARNGYAWRSLLDAGATLAFGTDAPVERIEPLHSIHAAVTRHEPRGRPVGGWYPEQRLTLWEAVHAYTVGSARAERAENFRGSLAVGKQADMIVLSRNPFDVDEPEELLDITVDTTVTGGRIVHQR